MYFFNRIFNWLCDIDEGMLLIVNGSHTPFLDKAMWLISDKWFWVPLYVLLIVILLRKAGIKKGILSLLLIAALITATDQTCASLIRPLVCRMRPTNPDNPVSALIVPVNGYHGGLYGFPSCHAANTFALAVFLSLIFRNRYATLSLLSWSLLVSYSRVYLGVHYPADILGGYAVGSAFAMIYYLPLRWFDRTISRIPAASDRIICRTTGRRSRSTSQEFFRRQLKG